MASSELEELRLEIGRLSAALEEASSEKIQAAQYGLQVLEDKQQVEQKCIELESQLDTVRHELDTAREVRHFSPPTFIMSQRISSGFGPVPNAAKGRRQIGYRTRRQHTGRERYTRSGIDGADFLLRTRPTNDSAGTCGYSKRNNRTWQ